MNASHITITQRQITVLQKHVNSYPLIRNKQWEKAAVNMLAMIYEHETGEKRFYKRTIAELVNDLQEITGEDAQVVFNSAVALAEIELFKPSIH